MRHLLAPLRRLCASTALPALLLALLLPASLAQAGALDNAKPLPKPVKMRFCLFDPMGAGGDITSRARDLALEAQKWNLFVEIKSYMDERVAAEDFKAGQCEGVAMTTLRAKQFNRMVGSIDSPGNLPDYEHVKSLLKTLSNPVLASLGINGRYQVVGVAPIGSIFVVVNDRSINSIEKAAGKKVVVLDWDPSMGKMISSIGAQPVPADLTTYAGKFNNGQADIIAAPAMAYQPMELYRGIGKKGGIINFPLLQATGTVLIRRDLLLPKIPDLDLRLTQVREYGMQHIDTLIDMLKKGEKDIPKHLWVELSAEEKLKYSRMLREARIYMTREGVYDPTMMNILKRVRCKHSPANEECATFDE
ncbi:MAG: hypothetical protein K0S46_1239 [Moraxellaceae bacterium]|jgi:hypothetical protein|nr:hypothetical protein [Moraxellaceae bacterium]